MFASFILISGNRDRIFNNNVCRSSNRFTGEQCRELSAVEVNDVSTVVMSTMEGNVLFSVFWSVKLMSTMVGSV